MVSMIWYVKILKKTTAKITLQIDQLQFLHKTQSVEVGTL